MTKLNLYHGTFFWLSLFTVGFADFYIWMVSSGRIHGLEVYSKTEKFTTTAQRARSKNNDRLPSLSVVSYVPCG